ncbi:MAG: hypothetical protein KKC85_22905 [Gammaproteobacteria bacterium]|nr:hypothetical protein [Gammaproteobacteria bacterium]MBU1441035.1 hypothetical protein [Gammaproteobacteria bacterium]MBU2289256.1 hypothetical protein [Gammaproteobacteria bacterium]
MRSSLAALALVFAGCAHAQDFTRYQGAWQGPFLFYVVMGENGARGAPAVYPGQMRIADDGSVHGDVPEAACKMTGTSVDFVSPANASLDLTLSGCTDARFNGRFTGKLINNPVLRYGSLRLNSLRPLEAGTAYVTSVLQR